MWIGAICLLHFEVFAGSFYDQKHKGQESIFTHYHMESAVYLRIKRHLNKYWYAWGLSMWDGKTHRGLEARV